jgi:hypothetical protein
MLLAVRSTLGGEGAVAGVDPDLLTAPVGRLVDQNPAIVVPLDLLQGRVPMVGAGRFEGAKSWAAPPDPHPVLRPTLSRSRRRGLIEPSPRESGEKVAGTAG